MTVRLSASLLIFITATFAAAIAAAQARGQSPGLALTYREASGCPGLLLYTWNDDRSEVLTIRLDQAVITLPDGSTKFDLASAGSGIAVHVERTEGPRDSLPYCSDEPAKTSDRVAVWTAVSGTLRITLKRRAALTPVSAEVEHLVVRSMDGTETRARRTIQFTAAVAGLTP